MPVYLGYGALGIYLGSTARDFSDLFKTDENYVNQIVFISVMVLSVLIIAYLAYFSKKTLDQINKKLE